MCGIVGIIGRNLEEKNIVDLDNMSRSIEHRGPDSKGRFIGSEVAFIMQRLSIIDLSGGNQPLYSEDHSVILIANGEIYNHIELRESLIKRGHCFSTNSDCEVLIHLYEEYDLDFLKYVRGMFAFALYNKTLKKVILGRDRFGEKPLYLLKHENKIYFASELRAFSEMKNFKPRINPQVLVDYFHYRFCPGQNSIIQGIQKLRPASIIEINTQNLHTTEHSYWNFSTNSGSRELNSNSIEFLRELYFESLKLCVRSDVPISIALSGGLDSNLILFGLKRIGFTNFSSFTLGYEGQNRVDERRQAAISAQIVGCEHYPIEVNVGEMVESFPSVVEARDEPISDISGPSYFKIMQEVHKRGIKVILTGHGADEIFFGYPWVVKAFKYNSIRKEYLEGGNTLLSLLVKYQPFNISKMTLRNVRDWIETIKDFSPLYLLNRFSGSSTNNIQRFYEFEYGFKTGNKHYKNAFSKRILETANGNTPNRIYEEFRNSDEIKTTILKSLFSTYLIENGLTQIDRLAMFNSVESRLPYLDFKFVENSVSYINRNNMVDKKLLREISKSIVPDEILNRPKQGFAPPTRKWIEGLYQKYSKALLSGVLIENNIMTYKFLKEISATIPHSKHSIQKFHKTLVLEYYLRKYL